MADGNPVEKCVVKTKGIKTSVLLFSEPFTSGVQERSTTTVKWIDKKQDSHHDGEDDVGNEDVMMLRILVMKIMKKLLCDRW